jgi:hypothetical protein
MEIPDPILEAVKAAQEEQMKRPPGEWFDRMVELGVIDKNGRVLRRIPRPPGVKVKPKAKRTKKAK